MSASRYERGHGYSLKNKRIVWEKCKGLCVYCLYPGEHIDHIVPYSCTQDSSLENLILSCARCNLLASALVFNTFEEKREYVLSKRRPEMMRDYKVWNSEIEEEQIGLFIPRRYWKCQGCKRICSITEFDLEVDACNACIEIIPKLERMFKVMW